MNWKLTGPDRILDQATLERMYETALDMLGRIGLKIEHAEVEREIARRKGFTLADGRVRIAPDRVAAWKTEHARRAAVKAQGYYGPACQAGLWPAELIDPDDTVSLDGYRIKLSRTPLPDRPYTASAETRAFHIVDRDGVTVRPITRDDVVAGTKLVAALAGRGLYGSVPGVPTDVPPALAPLEQFMVGAEFSPTGGFTSQVCDIPTAKVIREMNRVYGRKHRMSVQPPSPMILGGPELDILWHFRDDMAYVNVGSMPLMGFTAPCDPVAAFTQAMAECAGGAAILHELLPETFVSITPHPEPVDMRTGAIVFGSPEWQLLDMLHRDVLGFFGVPRDFQLLHTTAALPGPQAFIDHTASATAGMMCGYRHFCAAGQLSLDEVFSPAMLILDLEMLDHVHRMVRGVYTGEGLELGQIGGVVEEVVRTATLFAEHETTLMNMRRQYHQPKVLARMSMNQWLAAGRPDQVRAAQAEADKLIAAYEYEPPRDVLVELRRIYEKAKAALA